ncbi:MAG: endonuclease/exonuclease/phosphatase family protein [Anaerolineales bacterium]|nr:endonuclease/exonuclease/phosphatase family protein [Anaerolineales bacterium]
MQVSVGTFNLNNLFSRFNFEGALEAINATPGPAGSLTLRYEFSDPNTFRVRTFRGKLVKAKDPEETQRIADRIITSAVDVLAVQEVENIGILRRFNQEWLGGSYRYQTLIEGNDPRFIDVAILSKLPVGPVTSFQTTVHPADLARPVFGRDLLEVQIWDEGRTRKLFTLYNNHLKSNFVPYGEDPVAGAAAANARRLRQAEMVARIVADRNRPDGRFVLLGDMNDSPESPWLEPFTTAPELNLHNALAEAEETRPPKPESSGPGPATPAWTYRHKEANQPPEFHLYDQIWISPPLVERQRCALIDRRTRHGGDGSDHDLAWITLDL